MGWWSTSRPGEIMGDDVADEIAAGFQFLLDMTSKKPSFQELLDATAQIVRSDGGEFLLDADAVRGKPIEAVFEQPARQRQHHASLKEDHDRSNHWTMAGKGETRLEPPLLVVRDQFRQEDRFVIAALDRLAQHALDDGVDVLVAVFGRRAFGQQSRAPLAAQVVLDLAHHALDAHHDECALASGSGLWALATARSQKPKAGENLTAVCR